MASYSQLLNDTPYLSIAGYELDTHMQSIQIDERYVRLRSKLWQVLVYLVENQNKLVPRQTLIESCWHGNTYTGEQGVTHTICHLRRIFSKFGINAKIITIPKKGYILEDKSISSKNDTFLHAVQLSHEIKSSSDLLSEKFISIGK